MATLWHQPFQSPQMTFSSTWCISNQLKPMTVFCIACEQKFPDKSALEDHTCPAVSFICTCGKGFTDYMEMLQHRKRHKDTPPLQSDHISIMKEREQGVWLQKRKLQMLESIDQTLQQAQSLKFFMPFTSQTRHTSPVAPTLINRPVLAPPSPFTSPVLVRVTPPKSSPNSTPSPKSSSLANMPSRVLSVPPTVAKFSKTDIIANLTLQFQPAVVLWTKRQFHAGGPFMCATCRVIFWSKKLLVQHVSSHSLTPIHGCLRCGLLLLGHTFPHSCGTHCTSHRDRFTSGHFVFNASAITDQKQVTISRCPHCPAAFFQSWHLQQHIKNRHLRKGVLHLPEIPKDNRKREENMMNGVVRHTIPHEKTLQQTLSDMLTAVKRGPECLLEMNTRLTGMVVAQRGTVKMAQTFEDLKQQGIEVETVTEKQAQSECRCVICGRKFNTTQMLGQHWCKRNLMPLRQDRLHSMPLKSTGAFRSSLSRPSPYLLVRRHSEEMVTLRLQTSHDTDTQVSTLKMDEVKPIEMNPLVKSVAVQTKVEFDDGSYDTAITNN